jgi:hypothetical protein
MIIPSRFKLGGRTWRVIYVDKRKWFGSTSGTKCTIKLSTRCKTPEDYEHTFCHELVHAMCFTLGYSVLNDDEEHVDALGGLLLQALNTMEHS